VAECETLKHSLHIETHATGHLVIVAALPPGLDQFQPLPIRSPPQPVLEHLELDGGIASISSAVGMLYSVISVDLRLTLRLLVFFPLRHGSPASQVVMPLIRRLAGNRP
jgi:hypothetical protein